MLSPLAQSLSPLSTRSAVAAAFSPSDIAGLKWWLKADAGVLDASGNPCFDGGLANSWVDQSASGVNPVAPSSGARPTFVASAVNGKPGILCPGDQDYGFTTTAVAPLVPSAATMIAAFSMIGTTNNHTIVNTGPSDSYWRYHGDGNGYCGVLRGSRIETYPPSVALAAQIWSIRSSSSDYVIFRNGTADATKSASYSAGDRYSIGYNAYEAGSKSLHGYVLEICLYNTALSDTDRAKVESYLNAKYATY